MKQQISNWSILISLLSEFVLPASTLMAKSDGPDFVVSTYIAKRQEERESTRFTLTEWLRIKERMKMMDVWLAMFTDPKKDLFTPELSGSYQGEQGAVRVTRAGMSEESIVQSHKVGGQIYLTNLLTWTTKMRTLNIDVGGEGFIRETGELTSATTTPIAPGRKESLKYFMGNLRVFGKNVQDSSIVFKYGSYSLASRFSNLMITDSDTSETGQTGGAELQLYMFKWLGLEGNAMTFGDGKSAFSKDAVTGFRYEMGPYIEVSLLRLIGGAYKETWTFKKEGIETNTADSGYYAGVRLLL